MGCGCKSSNKVKPEGGELVKFNVKEKVLLGVRTFLLGLLVTLLVPVIWGMLLVMVYKSSYGGDFDVMDVIKKLLNKKNGKGDDGDLNDINPEDYEVVGVDKVD